MLFEGLNLPSEILEGLTARGYNEATPIQAETIPLSREGKDIIACAKTGSGKTIAFLIPIVEKIFLSSEQLTGIQGLIIVPTRELVIQIYEEACALVSQFKNEICPIFGGMDYEKQKNDLKNSPKLIIATPGRLLDFMRSKDADLQSVAYVVLDEADRMLDMGFIDDIRFIIKTTSDKRQVFLFSATLNYNALYAVWEYMKDPVEVFINPEMVDHKSISQTLFHLGREEKLPYIIQYIEKTEANPIIIFTNTRNFVETLAENLRYHNIPAQGLSSVINQNKRIRILNDFREKKFRVLVATDVASRGIHIDDVQLIINYDIPQDPESYIHRIGRTARAGKSGLAISISSENDYEYLARVESLIQYKIPVEQPDERLLENVPFVRIIRTRREETDNRSRGNQRDRNRNEGSRRPSKQNRDQKPPNHNTTIKPTAKTNQRSHNNQPKNRDSRPNHRPNNHMQLDFQDYPDYPASGQTIEKKSFFGRIFSIFKKKPKIKTEIKSAIGQIDTEKKQYQPSGRKPGNRKKYNSNNRNNRSSGRKKTSNRKKSEI